ncbi:MAG: DNA-binding response regulator [Gammaproteobacteria bacterium]|nr:DNA-binding response regulator [Gammaproteobacteria bacterium]OUU07060.1 MAG: DNA-binding response regulator [Gammaproteobacteria bacterium TMED34]|tara:strand:- start:731 stop:1405 length:675 start_codon:yes stop_codon:yes gene_type:complete
MARLLLVEDEAQLREQLMEILDRHQYQVDYCVDGAEAMGFSDRNDYDVAVIDLGLPRVPGMDVIRHIRDTGHDYPVLILTARGDWQDKVDGLGAGADDYLVKPFHVQEFLARLEALQRRAGGKLKPTIEAGPIVLDTRAKTVSVNLNSISLTAYEYKLMEYLMQHPGQVVSKSELTDHIYDQDFDRDSNVIEVFVGRLRRKLDPENSLKPIATVRGQGYRFSLA